MVSAIGYADSMSINDTEPITPTDTLIVSIAAHDAAQFATRCMRSVAGGFKTNPYHLRVTADWLEAVGEAVTPDILRRAADQIDPPTVPAEPDLTTADGWSALASEEADAGGQLPAIGSAEECAAAATARRCFDHSGAGWSLLTEALADWASTRLPR
jgi:hypothetical protein